ncbi:hypothetical protein HYDPIDRAFT_182115 [Hydnomerulius pinastri MD-312]|uniref:RBR-type E3 ubiquitin transferase n=1 Tax=Hydnomerulius pinastri MD-312 TaxID=994086 RepID=A0A0C9W8I4_9AGAM|nr:hypothetical protein HYDPIDRAFT_182115 [Hydnomerulius pinastri MD-312]
MFGWGSEPTPDLTGTAANRCAVFNVEPHLTQALVTEFRLKSEEYGTLARVYCAYPKCSRFLGPVLPGANSHVCPAPGCGNRTCRSCRGRHEGRGHTCRFDEDADQVLALSRASGWARCPGCSQMIELNTGCFHMTCRCRTEFCYLCQARWKTCTCPQWEERRLLATAEQRVDAQLAQGWANRAQAAAPARRWTTRERPVIPPARVGALAPAVPAHRRAPVIVVPAPAPATVVPARLPAPVAIPTRPPAPAVVVPTRPPAPATAVPARPPAPVAVVPARPSTPVTIVPATPSAPVRITSQKVSWETARERMIRETMDRLRVDHDCNHQKWKYRHGGGNCETCGHYLPHYLFRCQGCEIKACNRCRRNRL